MDEILSAIRRIIAEDEPARAAAPPAGMADREAAANAGSGGGGDILELTEAIDQDGEVRHLAPFAAPAAAPAADPPAAAEPEPAPAPEPLPAASVPVAVAGEAAAAASSTSLKRLMEALRRPASAEASPLVERSLDEIVRDELRPLLRVWIDDNLPAIVERLVRAEIARIAAGSAVP